jgi:acetyl-CoA/propionyl-CoA carboxylase biotin carboxyl carrier protein
VEFIVSADDPDQFYFMEMNTRLQVEHPVTELVTGLDLVEWQVRIAAGERLPGVPATGGHAVEARVYAEDPSRGFLPTGGTVLGLREPAGPHVRVDSGIAVGTSVTSAYDPMLGKVVAWGPDRAAALRRLDAALADTAVLGVTTNIAFLRDLLADPDVQAGRLDTGLAERIADAASGSPGPGAHKPHLSGPGGHTPQHAPEEVLAAAALARLLALEPGRYSGYVGYGDGADAVVDPWDIPDGWRIGGRAWTRFRFQVADGHAEVRVRGLASAGAELAVGDGDPVPGRAEFAGGDLILSYGGRTLRFAFAADGATMWLGRDGQAWALTEETAAPARKGQAGNADSTVRSPMPGTVLAVHAAVGDPVTAGQPLLVVEAMKMEHTVTAPADGTVTELTAKPGQQVGMDEPLAVIERQESEPDAQLPP